MLFALLSLSHLLLINIVIDKLPCFIALILCNMFNKYLVMTPALFWHLIMTFKLNAMMFN